MNGIGLLGTLLISLAVGLQSLGEIAKKEKERREANRKQAVGVRVIGEDEISTDTPESESPTDGEERSAPEAEPSEADFLGRVTSPEETRPEAPTREQREAEWRARMSQARARQSRAQERYEALRGLHLAQGEYYVDENGNPVITSLDQLRRMVNEAEAELEAANRHFEELQEEARRSGVPPGWLR